MKLSVKKNIKEGKMCVEDRLKVGEETSKFQAIFRIFSDKSKTWETISTVKFGTLAQFLSVLTLAVDTQTENIIDILEQLQARGSDRKEKLKNLKQKKHNKEG